MADNVHWLTPGQQRIWRDWLLGIAKITDSLDADLRSHGLDLAEYEILVALSEVPERSRRMSELATVVHQSRSRLTHAIARLEKVGWVSRSSSPDDRRGVVAHLTDAGFAHLEQAAPSHVTAVRRVFVDAVEPADFQAIGRAMKAVLAVRD